MAQIIDNGQAHTVIVERRRTVASVTKVSQPLKVASPGPQGQRGLPGVSGDGAYPAFGFAFGDASPAVVLVLGNDDQEITSVSLQVEEAFDGVGAAIALGVAGQPSLLMTAGDNDPGTEATYEVNPRIELAGGTQLVLTITPGSGASQGRGQFVIQSTPVA